MIHCGIFCFLLCLKRNLGGAEICLPCREAANGIKIRGTRVQVTVQALLQFSNIFKDNIYYLQIFGAVTIISYQVSVVSTKQKPELHFDMRTQLKDSPLWHKTMSLSKHLICWLSDEQPALQDGQKQVHFTFNCH